MEKHNPSSFTVDSSSPAHRSSFAVHDLAPYINWIYFFHAWGFQPRYAAIANIHGCDSCRAVWLTTFPEEERGKASEAMQLYKEANRMLNELDRDFEVKTIFKLCPANADGDNLIIDGIIFPLLPQVPREYKPAYNQTLTKLYHVQSLPHIPSVKYIQEQLYVR